MVILRVGFMYLWFWVLWCLHPVLVTGGNVSQKIAAAAGSRLPGELQNNFWKGLNDAEY